MRSKESVDKILKALKKSQNKNSQAGKVNKGYTNKSGTTFGLFPRFYWDVDKVQFGGLPNARMENFAPSTGASPKLPKKNGGAFSRAKREFGEKLQ